MIRANAIFRSLVSPIRRHQRIITGFMSLFIAAGLFACSGKKATEPPKIDYRPSIVLVTVDSLRADFLGCYGNPVMYTPFLDREARRSWQFTRASNHAPYTVPACASLMTSLYPFQHNARNIVVTPQGESGDSKTREVTDLPLAAGIETWAASLKSRGYDTRAYVGGFTLSSAFSGLNNGFERYDDSLNGPSRPGGDVIDSALKDLSERSQLPFFMWIHLFDAHFPYLSENVLTLYEDSAFFPKTLPSRPRLPERLIELLSEKPGRKEWGELIGRYATAVTAADRQIGRLQAALQEKMGNKKVYRVFSADHGESLLEHEEYFDHGRQVFDTTVHIPLLMSTGKSLDNTIVQTLARSVDVWPTVDDFCGYSSGRSDRIGKSLKPLLSGSGQNKTIEERTVFEGKAWLTGNEEGRARGIVDGIFKFIEIEEAGKSTQLLFNLEVDPGEVNDLSHQLTEKTAACSEILESYLKLGSEPDRSQIPAAAHDESTKDQLKSLGYLGD